MKRIVLFSAIAGLLLPSSLLADSRYLLMPVGDGTPVVRTADGTEVGRLEYLIVEPSSRRVVATVATGGAVGDQFVVVPFKAVRFQGSSQMVLTDIKRDRLSDAPPIQRVQLTSTSLVPASVVDGAFEHFGLQRDDARGPAVSAKAPSSEGEEPAPARGSKKQTARAKSNAGEEPADADVADVDTGDSGTSAPSRAGHSRRRG